MRLWKQFMTLNKPRLMKGNALKVRPKCKRKDARECGCVRDERQR